MHKNRSENNEELQFLYEVLSNIQYNKTCISIRRKWDKYLSNNSYMGTSIIIFNLRIFMMNRVTLLIL